MESKDTKKKLCVLRASVVFSLKGIYFKKHYLCKVDASIKISSVFPKHLFWDMDYESLDPQSDKDIIIPRALYMTNKSTFDRDIQKLESIYTASQIISQLKSTRELISNEVCELVARRYSIPVFRRFSKK